MRPVVNGLKEVYRSRMAFIEKDFYTPTNAELVKKYGVRGHPTIVVTDARGTQIANLPGVVSADQLATAIRKAVGDS